MKARRPGGALLLASLLTCALGQSGCAALVRKPAKAATEGAIAGAAEGVRAGDIAEMTSQITVGVVRGLARAADDPELAAGIERIAAAVGRAGVTDSLLGRRREILALVSAISAEMGRGLARGIGEEVARAAARGGPAEAGPLGEAIAATAQRTTAAAVRGAIDGAAAAIPCGEGMDRQWCLQQFARGLSRASAIGASEAVQQKASPWPTVIAFLAGGGAMLLLLSAWRTLTRPRSERRQPPEEPAPSVATPHPEPTPA